ncbi:hypothetical protein KDH83_30990, partial [Achromobacter sp. Marseille-Q0513]|uniref:DUF7674 family protein n=1 Tax=Achromobacter sp. Marseille-Q0513 TaxID=2829161 RepID=UPI001B9D6810
SAFIENIRSISRRAEDVYGETVGYWQPDEPPITALFAAFGQWIEEDFDNIEMDARRRIFLLIEQAMTEGDELVATAVATGLIEALTGKIGSDLYKWKKVSSCFGPYSLSHARAWSGM